MSRSQGGGTARHTVDASHASAAHKAQNPRRTPSAGDEVTAIPMSNQAFVRALGGGTALEPSVRAEMEARFGESFADVRIHDDAQAHRSAEDIKAKAYTHGKDVVFSKGRYQPLGGEGKRLLAHELAHVVQQRRGGTAPELHPTGAHESDAARAAAQVAAGGHSVTVTEATGVGLARDDEDEYGKVEKEETRRQRSNEKRRTTQRGAERADARGGARQSLDAKARTVLNTMMREVKSGAFAYSSPDTRLESLHRFKAALKDANMTRLDKSKLQGKYDELLRTPHHDLLGKPQTKWVAGHPATAEMDLPPGRSSYAQPEHSKMLRRGEALKRYHVNLKSDTIDGLKPGQARSLGRKYAKQAARNSRHLPSGEGIVLDFAEPGTPAVRDEICRGAFVKDGAIKEIRFHTRTVSRAGWEAEMGVGRPLDVDPRAKKERLATERQDARLKKAKAKADAREAKADARESKVHAKRVEQAALEKIRQDARQGGETVRRKYLEEIEAQRKRTGKPEPTKSAQVKLQSEAKKAGKAAERKYLEEMGAGTKSKGKTKGKGKKPSAQKARKAAEAAAGKRAKPQAKSAKPQSSKPAEAAAGKRAKPQAKPANPQSSKPAEKQAVKLSEAPMAPKAQEAKPPAQAPSERARASVPAGEPVAPKVEPGKTTLPVEALHGGVTPKKVAGAALGVAGGLGAVSGLKDIGTTWQQGDRLAAVGKTALLGLSFVPKTTLPFFALGTAMNFWGPRHEQIQERALEFGERFAKLSGHVPLLGRSETFRDVMGALAAADNALGQSIYYTGKDMVDAVGEGAEIIADVAEDAWDRLAGRRKISEILREEIMRLHGK